MPKSYLIQESGGKILLEDGTGALLLESSDGASVDLIRENYTGPPGQITAPLDYPLLRGNVLRGRI